jgi:hypothetical protein
MLSTVARAPGEGRQIVHDYLEARQAGQGGRVANQLAEGFRAPLPAENVRAADVAARDARAGVEYGAARQNAGPVNLTRTLQTLDSELTPRPANIEPGSVDAALDSLRRRLASDNDMLTDFRGVYRVRQDLADDVQRAVDSGRGNRAHTLGLVLRQLDHDMEVASPGFMQANRNYEAASRELDAITAGRAAATRGRPEVAAAEFQNLPPGSQYNYRTGYADPLIERAQRGAEGANKARPLTSDAFRDLSNVMAPGAARMQRQLERENTMFATRNQALGGSRTADNLADSAAMGVDPSMIGHVLSGNFAGALRSAMGAVSNGITGNTPAVRRAVGDILLARGVPAARFQEILDNTVRQITQVQQRAQNTGRTLAGLLSMGVNQATAPSAPPPISPLARVLATRP